MVTLLVASQLTVVSAQVQVIDGIRATGLFDLGDLNGDGKLDFAVVVTGPDPESKGRYIHSVNLHYQKDAGLCAPADHTISVPSAPTTLMVQDCDGDERSDLLVGMRRKRMLMIYPSSGDFRYAYTSVNQNDSGHSRSISRGHISPRGEFDFLTGAAWRKWMGGDDFEIGYFCGPDANDNELSTLVDLDWNGLDDIVFTSRNNQVRIYYGPFLDDGLVQAEETLVTLTSPFPSESQSALKSLFAAELNGDEQPDIVVGGADSTLIYFQNSPIGFSDGAGPSMILDKLIPLVVGDLNGDNLSDIAFRDATGSTLQIWRQAGTAGLTAESLIAASQQIAVSGGIRSAKAGDLNGDGRLEVIVVLKNNSVAVVSLMD